MYRQHTAELSEKIAEIRRRIKVVIIKNICFCQRTGNTDYIILIIDEKGVIHFKYPRNESAL